MRAARRVLGSDRGLVFGGLAWSSACRLSFGSMQMNLLVESASRGEDLTETQVSTKPAEICCARAQPATAWPSPQAVSQRESRVIAT
jgi:hypothetical protein